MSTETDIQACECPRQPFEHQPGTKLWNPSRNHREKAFLKLSDWNWGYWLLSKKLNHLKLWQLSWFETPPVYQSIRYSSWRSCTKIGLHHFCPLDFPISNIYDITLQKTWAGVAKINLRLDISWWPIIYVCRFKTPWSIAGERETDFLDLWTAIRLKFYIDDKWEMDFDFFLFRDGDT